MPDKENIKAILNDLLACLYLDWKGPVVTIYYDPAALERAVAQIEARCDNCPRNKVEK
jgi:hypothetical protein